MSIKLKAVSLGLFALMATSAFGAMNAGAAISGHFAFGSHHTFITGSVEQDTLHELHFFTSDNSRIGCDVSELKGTHKGATTTTTELTITLGWEECYTTPDITPKFDIDENGCHLVFKSTAAPGVTDATVTVRCSAPNAIVFTHPNCEITLGPQTAGGAASNGVTYTNQTDTGGDWITMDVKVKITTTYHGGICIFLGTNQTGTLAGSVTLTGYSNAAHTIRTNIRAT